MSTSKAQDADTQLSEVGSKADMVFRAVFGERDPKTLKYTWGLQDKANVMFYLLAFLCAHALGVPTDKALENVGKFFTASAAVLSGK